MKIVNTIFPLCTAVFLAPISVVASDSATTGVMRTPEQIEWVDNPRVPGLGVARIMGNAKKPGPFVPRVKFPAGRVVQSHSHPDDRTRRDAFIKVSKYLGNESSLKADFRYYEDDWQISSQTYGLKLTQRISRELNILYRYRFYTQVPAWFYRDDYQQSTSVDGYQTGDYRLGDYGAHLFGGHISWHPESLLGGIGFLQHTELNLTYERYFNSNNFTANIIETSVSVSF